MLSRIRVPYVIAAGLAVVIVAVAMALLSSDEVALGREGGEELQVDDGQELVGEGMISLEEAVVAAQAEASGTVDDIEVERRDGRVVYDIEVGNTDVLVDAQDGSIISTRTDDDDDEDDDADDGITDPAQLADVMSVDEASEIARGVASGTVSDVELEDEDGRLVYSIEIGQQEVEIDATDGTVLDVEDDD